MHYGLRLSVSQTDAARDRLLPAADFILCVLEDADRMAAGVLGLDLDCHRMLKEMSSAQFYYSVTIRLRMRRQPFLGDGPVPAACRQWMTKVRADCFRAAAEWSASETGAGGVFPAAEAGVIAGCWDDWAGEGGLKEAIVYAPPSGSAAASLLTELGSGIRVLGNPGAVTLEDEGSK